MRIIADENCDRLIVVALRDAGHDVSSVRESDAGRDDEHIFTRARIESRIILTGDLDFGLLVERELSRPPAIVVMRLGRLGRLARARRVVHVLQAVGSIEGHLVIVEPTRIRIRAYKRG